MSTTRKAGLCDSIVNDLDSAGLIEKKPGLMTVQGDNISEEKIEAMKNYARTMRKKFPHMKEARLQRKVAEHFKVKLV